jgi:2-methylcitrate dehydratase PrpD
LLLQLGGGAAAVAALKSGQALAAAPAPRLSPPVTGALCDFISSADAAIWPEEILDLGRRHLLDTLAAIVACHELQPAIVARRYVASLGTGRSGGLPIWGGPERAPLTEAVFANAMAGHAAEINDFSPSAFVQPGPSVVSVALGLAQARSRSGRSALQAIITGYELACRIPKAVGIANLRASGVANHGIGPTFGCGAAAAALMRLPPERVGDVLSYCAEQASGSWQWLLDTDHIEKAFVFAGMGAQRGLQAALMVEAGFTGVPNCLDRPGGWLDGGQFTRAGGDLDRAYLIEGLGVRFELPLVGYKRYAAGGPTQAGVQGLLRLVQEVDRARIRRVLIEMPDFDVAAFRDAAMPALNLPYMCALILQEGRLDFMQAQSRARMQGDNAVRALMARVELARDPGQNRTPRVESARVTVTLDDGSTRSTFVDAVKGFPTSPLSKAEVADKARELLAPKLGATGAERVIQLVWTIDRAPKVDDLVRALRA